MYLFILCMRFKPVNVGIKPDNPKENQPWVFIGRTDAKAEAPILWPSDAKIWLVGKDPDAGKDWKQEEKGTTEDEMVGQHHQLKGPEFEHALGVGDGQVSLACCSPWGCKELDITERLNWTKPQENDNVLKKLKCSSTDELIKKMWYIYTMGYYSATKRTK